VLRLLPPPRANYDASSLIYLLRKDETGFAWGMPASLMQRAGLLVFGRTYGVTRFLRVNAL